MKIRPFCLEKIQQFYSGSLFRRWYQEEIPVQKEQRADKYPGCMVAVLYYFYNMGVFRNPCAPPASCRLKAVLEIDI